MDRFLAMNVYVAVAEEESFAAAARRLGMSPPAVTRAVAALERHLNVRLLTRTTRFVRATDAGRRYLEHARRIIAAADEGDAARVVHVGGGISRQLIRRIGKSHRHGGDEEEGE